MDFESLLNCTEATNVIMLDCIEINWCNNVLVHTLAEFDNTHCAERMKYLDYRRDQHYCRYWFTLWVCCRTRTQWTGPWMCSARMPDILTVIGDAVPTDLTYILEGKSRGACWWVDDTQVDHFCPATRWTEATTHLWRFTKLLPSERRHIAHRRTRLVCARMLEQWTCWRAPVCHRENGAAQTIEWAGGV